jgi:death-on-curing protein
LGPGEWAWVPAHLVRAWHERLITIYGGAPGVRDIALLEGALDRPRNRLAYQPDSTLEERAALYGVGIAKAHAFVDGNKRIAFAVMVSFLRAHGRRLDVSEDEATATMLDVAASRLTDDVLAAWLRANGRDM